MKISVITINRNNADGLKRTIESVVSQTSKNYEYIVIDGASSDNSINIISDYKKSIKHWISEPDKGIYHAMNKGIALASGDYCIFMNSGDCFSNNFVLKTIENYLDTDIISGYASKKINGEWCKIAPPQKLFFKQLRQGNIPHQAEFIKRSLFNMNEIGLYSEDLKILADYEFNIKCALADKSYRTIPIQIAILEPNGISETQLISLEAEKEKFLRRLLPDNILRDYAYLAELENKNQVAMNWYEKTKLFYKIDKNIRKLFKAK